MVYASDQDASLESSVGGSPSTGRIKGKKEFTVCTVKLFAEY